MLLPTALRSKATRRAVGGGQCAARRTRAPGRHLHWFTRLFATGHDILEADLKRAELVWKARSKMVPPGTRLVAISSRLIATRRASRMAAGQIAYCQDPLLPETKLGSPMRLPHRSRSGCFGLWSMERPDRRRRLGAGLRSHRQNARVSAVSGRHCSKGQDARISVWYWKLPPALSRFRPADVQQGGRGTVAAIAPEVLAAHSDDGGRNAVVDFANAMALVSKAGAVPSEKAFTRAMEQISPRRPPRLSPDNFRRMLAEHGGIDTARRLIRGAAATTGFETLWENKRLDLSVEALILKPDWRDCSVRRNTASREALARLWLSPEI